MVSTSQALETDYVNAELVKNSGTRRLVILGEGQYETTTYDQRTSQRLTLPVEIDGKHKKWQPNRDSIKSCNQLLGNDTKHWVGRIILLTPIVIKGKDTVLGVPDSAGMVKQI